MKVSINWLREYVDLVISPQKLIALFNNLGILVNTWEEKDGDYVLDVETYSNRPDILSHLGIARELSVALGRPLKEPNWPQIEIAEEFPLQECDVQIWEEDLCPRYCAVILEDVQIGPSPPWLTARIRAMGLTPVNNVVDVTNFVLFATGQPIHAFDLDKLHGRKVIVRTAQKDETLHSLEGKTVSLYPDMLVIADESQPVALAGIIGGKEAGITEDTQSVFIESAYFDPGSVLQTGRTLSIQTDAFHRYARGADISYAPLAAQMAAALITQTSGKMVGGVKDIFSKPRKIKTVMLRQHRILELLGIEIEEDFIISTLSKLGFKIEDQQQGIWRIQVPSFRVDISREADLIEEIVRFYGYDRIPSLLPTWAVLDPGFDQKISWGESLRQVLLHEGFDEVVNLSFISPEREANLPTGRKAVRIRNPLSSKASLLRTTLISGLLDNIIRNVNRGADGVHIFEIGKIFSWEEDLCREQLFLAIATLGLLGNRHWQTQNAKTDFFHLKGACEAFLDHLNYAPVSFQAAEHPCFEPGHSLALLVKGEKIGDMGLLRSDILELDDIKEEVWAAEIDLGTLFEKPPQLFKYAPVIKYPSVIRDVSFMVDRHISFESVKTAIAKLSIPFLVKFDVYDRFLGPSVPKDKISLALRFVFQHPQKTLVAEEVDQLLDKIVKHLQENFKFQLREGGEN